jgi:hypothetical protein
MKREANLFDAGCTCPIKDRFDSTCAACPVSQAAREDGTLEEMRLSRLCKIGAEQDRTNMLLLAKQLHGV